MRSHSLEIPWWRILLTVKWFCGAPSNLSWLFVALIAPSRTCDLGVFVTHENQCHAIYERRPGDGESHMLWTGTSTDHTSRVLEDVWPELWPEVRLCCLCACAFPSFFGFSRCLEMPRLSSLGIQAAPPAPSRPLVSCRKLGFSWCLIISAELVYSVTCSLFGVFFAVTRHSRLGGARG